VEIGTTPSKLASGTETVGESGKVWFNGLSPNKTPPNKGGWGRWMALMDSIVTHCEKKWELTKCETSGTLKFGTNRHGVYGF